MLFNSLCTLTRNAFQLSVPMAEFFKVFNLDVISLMIKYYVPLAPNRKVRKLLKFKSAENLMGDAIERARNLIQSHPLDCLRLPLETLQIHCRFKL